MSFFAKILWMMMKKKIYKSYIQQKKIRNLPYEEIKIHQWHRLKQLLSHVEKNSQYYKHIFEKQKISIDDIDSYEEFRKIPIMDKKKLNKFYDQIKAINISKKDFIISKTSGTTGEPFSVLIDKKREPANTFAAYMLNKEHAGIDPFKKQNELMLKIFPVNEIRDFHHQKKLGVVHKFTSLLSSETIGIKSTYINEENIHAIYSLMKKSKIKGIYGYSSNVFSLAYLFKKHGLRFDLNYVILIAEGIREKQKKLISEIFQSPVFMDYGASECMRMGFECKICGGYHMDLYNYYFEFLDDNNNPCKPGQEANLVITNLNNYIFPLIRYWIGDKCITPKNSSSCDINYPIVPNITGRKSDTLNIHDKKIPLINLHVAIDLFYDYIFQYKIIIFQKEKLIQIDIVPIKEIPKEIKQQIKNKMSKLVYNSMKVDLKIVDNIPCNKTGKMKPIEIQ